MANYVCMYVCTFFGNTISKQNNKNYKSNDILFASTQYLKTPLFCDNRLNLSQWNLKIFYKNVINYREMKVKYTVISREEQLNEIEKRKGWLKRKIAVIRSFKKL